MIPSKRIAALAVLVCLLPFVTFAQRTTTKQQIPKEIVEQITADGEGDCSDAKALKATWVDLNGDRIPEIIVKMENSCSCGAGANCTNWVYQKTDVGYVLLLERDSAAKLYSGTNSSHGFKDLVSEHTMGASEIAVIVYKWDSYRYKPSTCWTRLFVGTRQGKPVYKTTPAPCDVEEPAQTGQQQASQQQARPVSQNQPLTMLPIVQQSFTVGAGKYVWYRFTITGQNARVIGRFQATGGSGNDVEVFILGQDEFTNFQNGHNVNTWFNSGRATVSSINQQMPPGAYYLVFSNTFSMMTPKAVNAGIRILQ